jgi:hypothetical protein
VRLDMGGGAVPTMDVRRVRHRGSMPD